MADEVEYVTPTRSMLRRYLQRMDPYQFEAFVGDLWERFGWETRVVGEPGDRGIDVIATATTDEGPQKQLLQVKRYGPDTTVGSPEVQQYASLRLQAENVDQVTIVTTGEFTRQAEDLAPDLDVILVDGEELLGLIDEVDGWELVAAYFDDIEIADQVETDSDTESVAEHGSILDRVRSLFR